MPNPMSFENIRELCKSLSPVRADLLHEYTQFVYDVTWPIESELGEYSGSNFDKDKLLAEVKDCIFKEGRGTSQRAHKNLTRAFGATSLGADIHQEFLAIAFDEASQRIESGVYKDPQGSLRFREHGHHGRQYISRNAEARAAKILLALK